ncbi:MAG: NAD(P)-dependent oxidoreductase [Gammaproteobacteria bacterium]|nr:MAG: NAD(P)-dependent oxidoreductase [Gammaproteobacteria bacterium]
MKVLVTGASGFLGNTVINPLIQRGHEIVALNRRTIDQNKVKVSWVKGDIHSPAEIDTIIKTEKPEGLLHLAWDTTHGNYWNSNRNLCWTAASLYLAESFIRHGGKRIVVAGTSAEYKWGHNRLLEENKSEFSPDSLYGINKYSLREIIQASTILNDVSWAWGHIFNIFGPGEKRERLIPRVIVKLLNDEKIIFDDGMLYRDFLYVDDAGSAFAALFDCNVQGSVNIASGKAISVRYLVQTIAKILGKPGLVQFDEHKSLTTEPAYVVGSVERLRKEVRWSPEINFYQRLQYTCDWWKNSIKENIEEI